MIVVHSIELDDTEVELDRLDKIRRDYKFPETSYLRWDGDKGSLVLVWEEH